MARNSGAIPLRSPMSCSRQRPQFARVPCSACFVFAVGKGKRDRAPSSVRLRMSPMFVSGLRCALVGQQWLRARKGRRHKKPPEPFSTSNRCYNTRRELYGRPYPPPLAKSPPLAISPPPRETVTSMFF